MTAKVDLRGTFLPGIPHSPSNKLSHGHQRSNTIRRPFTQSTVGRLKGNGMDQPRNDLQQSSTSLFDHRDARYQWGHVDGARYCESLKCNVRPSKGRFVHLSPSRKTGGPQKKRNRLRTLRYTFFPKDLESKQVENKHKRLLKNLVSDALVDIREVISVTAQDLGVLQESGDKLFVSVATRTPELEGLKHTIKACLERLQGTAFLKWEIKEIVRPAPKVEDMVPVWKYHGPGDKPYGHPEVWEREWLKAWDAVPEADLEEDNISLASHGSRSLMGLGGFPRHSDDEETVCRRNARKTAAKALQMKERAAAIEAMFMRPSTAA